jgi:hypothetical protein
LRCTAARLRCAANPMARVQANRVRGSVAPPPPLLPVELPPPVLLLDEPPLDAAAVAITVAMAEPSFVESTTDTAAIVTVAGVGTVIGAVYTPDAEIIPTMALPPAVPLTLQFTAVLEAPATAALNV